MCFSFEVSLSLAISLRNQYRFLAYFRRVFGLTFMVYGHLVIMGCFRPLKTEN